MISCYQFQTMNVLEHGYSVLEYFEDLYEHLAHGTPLKKEWRLPDWISEVQLDKLLPLEKVRLYLIYHDCGKALCRTYDKDGKQHFPDHANVSADRWERFSPDKTIAKLIRMDMDIHTLTPEGVEEFKSRPEAVTLLLAGLSELHSNAVMFGGIESTSFKIKWKRLNKLGRRILT